VKSSVLISSIQRGVRFSCTPPMLRCTEVSPPMAEMLTPTMLSDQQWDALFHACRPLPPDTRDAFVRALANRLSG
jgi:hypothetical protein